MILLPKADFRHRLASVGLSIDDVSSQANVSRSAIFSWLHPHAQPNRRGIRIKNAWAIARIYAQVAGIDKQEAFDVLFIEA